FPVPLNTRLCPVGRKPPESYSVGGTPITWAARAATCRTLSPVCGASMIVFGLTYSHTWPGLGKPSAPGTGLLTCFTHAICCCDVRGMSFRPPACHARIVRPEQSKEPGPVAPYWYGLPSCLRAYSIALPAPRPPCAASFSVRNATTLSTSVLGMLTSICPQGESPMALDAWLRIGVRILSAPHLTPLDRMSPMMPPPAYAPMNRCRMYSSAPATPPRRAALLAPWTKSDPTA